MNESLDTKPISVLLAEDHDLFAQGLKTLLELKGIRVMGTVRDGSEAVVAARLLRPEIILMDIEMPGCDGLCATRRIKAEFPEIKIVMLTMSASDDDLFEAVRSGASGYLLKNLDAESFFTMLHLLSLGETVFSPELAQRLLYEFPNSSGKGETPPTDPRPLTPRQEEILTLTAQGKTYKQTAQQLGLSVRTVRYHMNEILSRLHLENRAQAIAYRGTNTSVPPRDPDL